MITLDFYTAVAVYSIIIIGVMLIFWLFTKKEKERNVSLDPRFLWFCSVCTYTYINTREEVISECPRCGSFNKK